MIGPFSVNERGGPPNAVYNITCLGIPGRGVAPFGLGLLPDDSPKGLLRNRILAFSASNIVFGGVSRELQRQCRAIGVGRGSSPAQPSPTSSTCSPPSPLSSTHVPTCSRRCTTSARCCRPHKSTRSCRTGGRTSSPRPGRWVSLGLPHVPANARVAAYLPFSEVMEHVSVYVTNGGYGGVQYALSAGVPIVAAGTTEDKPAVGNRVADSGVGRNLRTATPSPQQCARPFGRCWTTRRTARRPAGSLWPKPAAPSSTEVDRRPSEGRRAEPEVQPPRI
jgi:hypothetical protein